jgi:uncharacterized protein YbjT (DUF2867 family)
MTSPVLLTGGTGRLGQSVVARPVAAGQEVRVLARHQRGTQPQVTFFTGDLRRGEGIDAAVRGAGVIINCATSTRGDAEVTANLVKAAARAGSPHFVQPSITGIDSMAQWGYVKAKLEVERIVESCGLPWTILRATQFDSYCLDNSRKLARFPLAAPVPRDFTVKPVDSREVAARPGPGHRGTGGIELAGPVPRLPDSHRPAQAGGPRAGPRRQGRPPRRPAPPARPHRRGHDLGPVPSRGTAAGARWAGLRTAGSARLSAR